MKRNIGLLLSVFVLIVLSACQGSTTVALQTNARSWVDAPLEGSRLPLAPVEIIAHATDLVQVVMIEVSVNGNVLATIPNSSGNNLLATVRQNWTPTAPGNYTIRARALNANGVWGEYAESNIVIGNAAIPPTPTTVPAPNTPTPPRPVSSSSSSSIAAATPTIAPTQSTSAQPPAPTHTNTPRPTATHTPQPTKTTEVLTKPVLNDHAASANLFYWGGTTCGTKQITFRASASDPNGIASVQMYFQLVSKSGGASTNWTSVAMSNSGGLWSHTIESENDVPGYATNSPAWFNYYYVLKNNRGQQTQSQTFSNSITLDRCNVIK